MNCIQLTLTPMALATLLACGGAQPAAPGGAQGLPGDYRSDCLAAPTADGGTQYTRLDFAIAEATWAVDYTVHGDAACTSPLVTVHIEGPYELGAPVAGMEGVIEARFGFTEKKITPHVEALAGALASMGCGSGTWTAGEGQNVLETGCAGFGQYPRSRCEADFDLVKVTPEGVQFGARPADNDMCTPAKRPTALNPVLFRRL